MGIYNRDYMRDGNSGSRWSGVYRGGGASNWPPVVKWLLVANIVVFLFQIFVTRDISREEILQQWGGDLPTGENAENRDENISEILSLHPPRVSIVEEWFKLSSDKVLHGQVWRMFTSAFCHDRYSVWHILVNMLFLVWFGKTLERMYGSREFLLFYLVAAFVASAAFVALDLVTVGPLGTAIGASGAVMAVTMLYAIHFPRDKVYVFLIIPIEIRWLVLFYVIFDLHPVLLALAGDDFSDGVAHSAHLGGLLFGFLYWKCGWHVSDWWDAGAGLLAGGKQKGKGKGKSPRGGGSSGQARQRRKVIPMPGAGRAASASNGGLGDPKLAAEVDRILQKLSNHGNESLTEAERQTLVQASERLNGDG